jgi:Fe-S oxidoreductase/nitrate reductase gamma subunit
LLTAFDVLLIAAAFIIMLAGLARRWLWWRMGRAEDRPGHIGELLGYLLGHKKILKNPSAGIAHLVLFWGFAVPLLVVILAQFGLTMKPMPSRVISFLEDIVGIAMLVGVVYFLFRRLKSGGPDAPKRAILPVVVLLFILLTGFLAEGARLSIVPPEVVAASPIGWLFSKVSPDSPRFMQLMIRFHFFGVLLFIAILPFTFMRHLAASSLNVFYRKRQKRGELRPVSFDDGAVGAAKVPDLAWKQLLEAEACVSCGRCDDNCPALFSGKPLSPRKVMRNILEQMEEAGTNGSGEGRSSAPLLEDAITGDEIWACTTCMACVEHCPVFIEPIDKIVDMRRYQVMGRGMLPDEARSMIRDLEIYGDVQGKGASNREDWALNRDVPTIRSGSVEAEVLLWVGCSGAFHPRYQEVTRSMVEILKAGGVNYAILGKEEMCCGDPARRLGEETLFLELARKNISRFHKYNFQKVVTLCPHCFNTLKNEYPSLGAEFEVLHAAEFVKGLIEQKKILFKYPVEEKIAIHDPCYLGRMNNIYDPLRDLIRDVPGVELKELNRNRECGFCCGGGGGRMWLHESLGRNINQIRSEEVAQAGVDTVGVACPYCLTMLDDGIKSLEVEKMPRVSDIIEVVAYSIA